MKIITFKFASVFLMILTAGGTCKGESCKDLKAYNPKYESGVYKMYTSSDEPYHVYCEMGLNGGAYTFLSPAALSVLTDEDLQTMITDRKSLLIRVLKKDGTQPYAVLQQLTEYQHIPIKIGLNDFNGYASPLNRLQIGNPYLYFGFLPSAIASVMPSTNGFRINGFQNTFKPCDRNANSLITLFPNFREVQFSSYHVPGRTCSELIARLATNPSGRVIPSEFFMFAEMHFGGCGCYDDTKRLPSVMGFAIGFR